MSAAPKRNFRMMVAVKERISAALDPSCFIGQTGMASNLRRAIHSTPNRVKPRQRHDDSSTASLTASRDRLLHQTSKESRGGVPKSNAASSLGQRQRSSSGSTMSSNDSSSMKTCRTRVLFSPSNSIKVSRPKLTWKFSLRRCTSGMAMQPTRDWRGSLLPTITLTTSDDEDVYFLQRPTAVIPDCEQLYVPLWPPDAPPHSHRSNSAPKQWPHPAGPWLRAPDCQNQWGSETYLAVGSRLTDGRIVGWDVDQLEASGIPMPPQLPTEQDLVAIALVEDISIKLDRAQNALFGSFEVEWGNGPDGADDIFFDNQKLSQPQQLLSSPSEAGILYDLYDSDVIEILG